MINDRQTSVWDERCSCGKENKFEITKAFHPSIDDSRDQKRFRFKDVAMERKKVFEYKIGVWKKKIKIKFEF